MITHDLFDHSISDARCSFCGKVMTKPYSLLQHIGTCHNQILNYVPPEVHKQLTQLGVKDQSQEWQMDEVFL